MNGSEPKLKRLVVEPNASLSWKGARRFLFVIAVAVLGVAGWFTAHGFWPVMIFAVANLIAMGVAVVVSLRHNAYREVLSFTADDIDVEFGFAGRGVMYRTTLSRHVTRAMLEAGPYRTSPSRLMLRCEGHSVEVGHGLTDRERVSLCARVRALLQPGWERPPPAVPGAIQEHVWR